MNNGWTNNTLADIEVLWKKRQRELYAEIPKPRFTQRDILERRGHNTSFKSKKARLTRTLSTPSTSTRKSSDHYPRPQMETLATVSENTPITHKFRFYEQPPARRREIKQNRSNSNSNSSSSEKGPDDSPPKHAAGEATGKRRVSYSIRGVDNRDMQANTLETLTYAIDIAENAQRDTRAALAYQSLSQPLPDIRKIEPNLFDEDEDESKDGSPSPDDKPTQYRSRSSSVAEHPRKCARVEVPEPKSPRPADGNAEKPSSPPPSPVTAAAQAIMMFFNDHYAAKPQSK